MSVSFHCYSGSCFDISMWLQNTRWGVVYNGDYDVMNEKVRNAREEAEKEKEAVSCMLEVTVDPVPVVTMPW